MSDGIILHVRFAPDGTVVEIGERPSELVPQDWFNVLSNNFGGSYQALAGGRGIFRLTRDQIESVKSAVPA